jgi:uncharacterized membrane protein
MRKLHIVTTAACAALLASCGGGGEQATPTAAATTAEPDPVSMSFLPADFRAFGTEPFWSAEISKDKLVLTTPENVQTGGVTVPVTRADGAENALFTAAIDGQVLQILVTPGACSDGMSDNTYPWTVERTFGEDSVSGCAEPPKPPSDAPKAP